MEYGRRTLGYILVGLGCGTAACAAPVNGAPAPPGAPEARAGDYRVRVEKIVQSENLTLDFDAKDRPARAGRHSVYLHLAVEPLRAELLFNIDRLAPQVLAFSGAGRPVTFQPYPVEQRNEPDLGTWRTLLMAQEVDLNAARLQKLAGELIVYPQASVTTLDFPTTGKLPLTRRSGPLTAVLREVKTEGGRLSLTMEVAWPPEVKVQRLSPEAPYGITLLTESGGVVLPTGGSSTALRPQAGTAVRYTATFSELGESPTRARLQLIVRSGVPEKLAFTLPPILLPDTLGAAAAPEEPDGAQIPADHALFAAQGGVLSFSRREGAFAGQEYLLGLAPADAEHPAAWRWVEIQPTGEGSLTVTHLRPGSYRVRLRPAARNRALVRGEVRTAPGEVKVVAGRTTLLTLPPPPSRTREVP